MARALVLHAGGQGFESLILHGIIRNYELSREKNRKKEVQKAFWTDRKKILKY